MKEKQFKTKTYVENPPVKDNITKTSFQMRFSKSNFVFIGKWIIAFVLVIVLGSQALNGFISSKFTKDSTTETIVHEYKKQIGVEKIGVKFSDFDSFTELNSYLNSDIYIYFNNENVVENLKDIANYYYKVLGNSNSLLFNLTCSYYIFDLNYELLYGSYSTLFNFNMWSSGYSYFFGTYDSSPFNISFYNGNTLNYNYGDDIFIKLYSIQNTANIDYNYPVFSYVMDKLFYFPSEEIPIYETTTYTYEVKDNNYNWDNKLKQLSKFKPLFNTKDLFVNEEFYEYANLITYEFKNTDIEKENVFNKYKSDERLNILFDNESISIKGREYNFHLIKEKKDYISYIYFDYDKLDLLDNDIYNAYMYALENYVSSVNIDNYFTYSKMNFEPKDLLTIMSFPIQIVLNTLYNFGVLVGFITWW